MNNINVKLISGTSAFDFQTELQTYLDSIDTDIFDVEIQYQLAMIPATVQNSLIKYSALVIIRRKS